MVVGFDVHRTGKGSKTKRGVGAMVATTNGEMTRYFSTVSFHQHKDELSHKMSVDFTSKKEYFENLKLISREKGVVS